MTRTANFAILMLLGLAACDSATRSQPVVVYVDDDVAADFAAALSRFTGETGIPVATAVGDSDTNTQSLIDNSGSPPADLLFTSSVAGIFRAAEEGALRPIKARSIATVPETLRDADGFWAAIRVRQALIGVAPQAAPDAVDDYVDLAGAGMRGKVCLSSSTLSLNRSLMAMMIEDLGIKPAERLVRGWVQNLATAPFASEPELLNALRDGSCDFGIVSSDAEFGGLRHVVPVVAYLDIDGIGIARHTENADVANQLVEWLLMDAAVQLPDASNASNVGVAGWRDGEARALAERVGYR